MPTAEALQIHFEEHASGNSSADADDQGVSLPSMGVTMLSHQKKKLYTGTLDFSDPEWLMCIYIYKHALQGSQGAFRSFLSPWKLIFQ